MTPLPYSLPTRPGNTVGSGRDCGTEIEAAYFTEIRKSSEETQHE